MRARPSDPNGVPMKKILLMVIIALLTVSPAAAEKKSDEDVLREIKETEE